MKILFVAPWVPTSRRPRSLQFISMLGEHHEVHVVAAAWSDEEVEEASLIEAASVTVVRLRSIGGVLRALSALFRGRSLQQAYVESSALKTAIQDMDDQVCPDIIFFNVLRSAGLASLCRRDARRVLDMDEFRSAYYRQLAAGSHSLVRRAVARLELARMIRAEGKAAAEFDICLVSSQTDMTSTHSNTRLVRSPHLLGEVTTDDPVVAGTPPKLLFVGRMSYAANQEAVRWFAEHVLPGLVAKHPDIVLEIVGEAPPKGILRLSGPNVRVVGRVDDVGPYYRQASVVVVPIQMATGVQMKLIEALACAKPTVVTTLVANLAGVGDQRECLVADNSDEWVAAICRILEDPENATAIARHGRRWLNENHGSESVRRQLDRAIAEVSDNT